MAIKGKAKIFVRLVLKDAGKPFIVFIHGDGQNNTVWKRFKEYFLKLGHSVLLYDLPGHGESEPYSDGKYSFSMFTDTLSQLLEKYRVERPILIGNSTGGMIALQYASQNPDSVTAVVAISSCDESPSRHRAGIPEMIKAFVGKSESLFRKQGTFDYSKPLLKEEDILAACLKYTSPEVVKGNLRAMMKFSVRKKLGRITCPVLLIRGEEDVFVDDSWAERMRKEIPNSRLVTVKGYGHHVLVQTPEKVLEILKKNYGFLTHR
jgi:pimeloyl-ACP methyl ester carboxylesterase